MNMKKLMAGVVAGALAVTSLATVGVFAEDTTKTFSFVGVESSMTVKYYQSANFRGGITVEELFGKLTDGEKDFDLTYDVTGKVKDGYKKDNEQTLKDLLGAVKVSSGTKITVKGKYMNTDAGEDKATSETVTATTVVDSKNAKETFRVVTEDSDIVTLKKGDLDLSYFTEITSVTLESSIYVNTTGLRKVAEGVCDISVDPDIDTLAENVDFSAGANYTSEEHESKGYGIVADSIYVFQGVRGASYNLLDNQGWTQDANYGIEAVSLGGNLLRWTNDNIEQNKGAKLRINFMTPTEYKAALQAGGLDTYSTAVNPWASSPVLTPGSVSGETTTQDIVMGVNLQSSTKATTINNYTAEFDWDTLVHNSLNTVSGNVDSIAFRLNPDSNNVKAFNGDIAIKSIEIVIPDQSTIEGGANDKVISLTAGSDDANVKVTGTIGAIYGNGAQDLQVTSDITDTNIKYSLKLTDANGAASQLAGTVTLQMSIPSKFKGQTLSADTVKHTCNDGTVEELAIKNLDTYKTDGYIVCETSKFSSFEFGFEGSNEEETTTEAPAVSEETTTEAPAADTQPADDGNQPTGVALAVIPAIVAAAGIVISKKRG